MTPEQRTRIDRIEQYYRDLVEFKRLLDTQVEAEAAGRRGPTPRHPATIEELRHSLLRRAGGIQPVFERVVGRLMQPQPFHAGPDANYWDLALVGAHWFSQTVAAGTLADFLSMAIGKLEDNPSLLDPPRAQPGSQPTSPRQSQTINVYGGTANFAQAVSSNVSQTISAPSDVDEIRRLLAELRQLIEDSGAPDEEREVAVVHVEQLSEELGKPKPRLAMLKIPWNGLQALATFDGAWQAVERAQQIVAELQEHLGPMLQAPPA
jgi:hypothetical protein